MSDTILQLSKDRNWCAIEKLINENRNEPERLMELASATCGPAATMAALDDDGEAIAFGRTALHEACVGGAPPSLVRDLLEVYPDGAVTADKYGNTPLHVVFQRLTSGQRSGDEKARADLVDIVGMLLHARPSAALGLSRFSGNTPLHSAIIHDAPEYAVRALLRARPEAAAMANRIGVKTPLEAAMDVSARPEVIAEIALAAATLVPERSFLAAVRRAALQALCAIEAACRYVLCELLDTCDARAVLQQSRADGGHNHHHHDEELFQISRKILHNLLPSIPVRWDKCFRAVAVLEALWPLVDKFRLHDKSSQCPMHIAVIQHFRPENAIDSLWIESEYLIRCIAASRRTRASMDDGEGQHATKPGDIPILDAVLSLPEIPLQYSLFLLQICQEIALEQNENGEFPLHVLLQKLQPEPHTCQCSLRLLRKLLELHPHSASRPNSQGVLPFHCLDELGVGWDDAMQLMVEAHPNAIICSADLVESALLPAMLARVGAGCSFDALFQLVRGMSLTCW